MDLIASQIAQLQEQARLQASSIARLSTENEAQASSIARLSLENEALGSVNKDQELIIGELVRSSIPGGFWLWQSRREEGREEEGRWVWSLEKYRVLPPLALAAGPPTSLLSLPVELLSLILAFLPRASRLTFLRVSFRLLEVASTHVYGVRVTMDGKKAIKFVESRVVIVNGQPAKSERISRLLVPHKLRLVSDERERPPSPSTFKKLARLLATTQQWISLDINVVTVTVFTISDLSAWVVPLRLLNPQSFQLWVGEGGLQAVPPTIQFVPQDLVDSFTFQWTRLESFASLGLESVLLIEGTKSTSAFEACLRRCSPDLPFVQVDIWTKTWENVETVEKVDGEDIPGFLRDVEDSDWGLRLVSLDLSMKKTRR